MTAPTRRQTLRQVWRVRGYNDGHVRFTRLLARRHDAFRVAVNAAPYYDDVTVECADIAAFVEHEIPEWWTP